MSKISIAILLTLSYNIACVDRDDVPEKLGILTSPPHTLLSGTMTGDSIMSKQIPLTQGKFAIVDDKNYEWLNQWKWHAAKRGCTFYAERVTSRRLGKQKSISMHREILNVSKGQEADHINHNGLDNRELNLRIVTRTQNMQNRRLLTRGTSPYKGVCWNKRARKWYGCIQSNGKWIYLGTYDNEIEAAKTYDRKAKELFGEFAQTNFKLRNELCL